MKKLVVFAASMLSCFLVYSQEADDSGRSVGLSFIPRIDLSTGSTLGDSSFYTLVEGDINEYFSFSICNHWWSAEDPQDLYKNTLYTNGNTWTDWANLTIHLGSFDLTGGKMVMAMGGFEFDEYDYEVHSIQSSQLWNNLACYQWGGQISWTDPSEHNQFVAQMTTSPYGIGPVKSKVFTYSLQWRGNYGPLETIWSGTRLDQNWKKKTSTYLVTLGQRVSAGDFTLGFDWFNKVGVYDDELDTVEDSILEKGNTFIGSVLYAPSEKWEVYAKGGYETGYIGDWFGGLAFHWYPLKDSKDLRVHATAGYSLDETVFSIGAIYHLNFPRKK